MRYIFLSLVLLFSCLALVRADDRQPIPDEAAIKEAVALVQDVFGEDLEKAKTADQKLSLTKKLLEQASSTDTSPSGRYAILRVALDIAPDASAAMTIIDEMAKHFQIGIIKEKASTVWRFSKQARTSSQHKAVAEAALQLVNESAKQDAYGQAMKLAEIAFEAAQDAKDAGLVRTVRAKILEARKNKADFEKVQTAVATLEKEPTNPDANLTVGKYKCLIKGDWESGAPMLALGGEASLKKLAIRELEQPTKSDEQIGLGDGWYNEAQNSGGVARERMLQRAAFWYSLSLKSEPTLSRLVRAKVEKRIAAAGVEPAGSASPTVASKGLKWLVQQQGDDGRWNFQVGPNPGKTQADAAATGLVLIALLRAGHTHKQGQYRESVVKGIQFLGRTMKRGANGGEYREKGGSMYSHGIATMALCEAYGRTKDRKLRTPAQLALDYTLYAQDPKGGGWRYKPRQAGDTSVTGWQFQALHLGKKAKLGVPDLSYSLTNKFLNSVQADEGSSYGYTTRGKGKSTTAIGLLCRMYLGADRDHQALKRGVQQVVALGPGDSPYYNYYAAQLMKEWGGDDWKAFSSKTIDRLTEQLRQEGEDAVSWYYGTGHIEVMGRLGVTAFTVLTLQACE